MKFSPKLFSQNFSADPCEMSWVTPSTMNKDYLPLSFHPFYPFLWDSPETMTAAEHGAALCTEKKKRHICACP